MDVSPQALSRDRNPERPPPSPRRRLWHLAGHPVHLTLASVALALGIILASPLGLLVSLLLLESIVIGVLPRLRVVQRWTDRALRDKRRRQARTLRNHLVPCMDPCHTDELAELEHRAAEARDHAARLGPETESLLDDWLDLDALLEAYVRLSIANREVRESLLVTNRRQIAFDLGRLRDDRERARNARVRALIDRDVDLLHRRLECLEEREREREVVASELASVATLCRLVHERVCVLGHPSSLSTEVERLLSEVALHDEALAETLSSAGSKKVDAGGADGAAAGHEAARDDGASTGPRVRVAPTETEDREDPRPCLTRFRRAGSLAT
jgi:hypothetical protein